MTYYSHIWGYPELIKMMPFVSIMIAMFTERNAIPYMIVNMIDNDTPF